MKQVTFLIADGVLKPSSLFNAIEIFEKANEFAEQQTGRPYYDIRLAGTNLEQPLVNGIFTLRVQPLKTAEKADLIILPSFAEQDDFAIRKSHEALDWVITQYQAGAEVASLCTGTFLLAATGLLEGKPCATHWKAAAYFRRLFPELKLHTNKIVTDQEGVYTAGGAISSLNLALHIIEKYNGRETALYCARVLQIDIDRNSQSPFMIFEGLKDHKDEVIRSIQDFIEEHVGNRLTVEQLASQSAMDRINFTRRFKKATQLSPADYVQRIKVESAKRLFESTGMQISEVMYEVGYGDVKAFRETFKKIAGMTPGDYRNKFNKII
ncbi:helix-turn-helix domain-containing protein [Chitinophaga sp. OAE865]|uniref:GlxA family transcriptional regulator n=1 Tax=Chitinophaga sp. OAE865 TaxID=2817898 RepID=UPI001AE4D0E9